MKQYPNCPVCGTESIFTTKNKIHFNSKNITEMMEVEEFLINVAKEKAPETVLGVCMRCRQVYRARFFDEKELAEIYNEAYYRLEEKVSKGEEFIYSNEAFLKGCSKKIMDLVKDTEKEFQTKIVDIFDIGGRDGFMMKDLSDDGYKCTVFDPIAREAFWEKISKQNMWSSQIEDRSAADFVLLCDVLAHCMNPKGELAICRQVLRDEGFLYIEVPYDLGTLLNWLLFMRWRRTSLGIDITHFIFFSLRTLFYLLEETGFVCVRAKFEKSPTLDNKLITILARKTECKVNNSYRKKSFAFDLIKSAHFYLLTKRILFKLARVV